VVTPLEYVDRYSADGVRYWAASGRPGTDTAFEEEQLRIGRRLAIKILNASRFALGFTESDVDKSRVTAAVDRSMLAGLAEIVGSATEAFEDYDYAKALDVAEKSFWNWTDDYLELVKARAYGDEEGSESAHAALQFALDIYLRLFAPFLPFVTEEVWSWWRDGSIHLQEWPGVGEFDGVTGDPSILTATSEVLTAVRRAKSDAKVSMRAEVERVSVTADAKVIGSLREAESDLKAAANTEVVDYSEGEFSVVSELAAHSSN